LKQHDESVSKEAEETKEELAKALEESRRNAKCVNESLNQLISVNRVFETLIETLYLSG